MMHQNMAYILLMSAVQMQVYSTELTQDCMQILRRKKDGSTVCENCQKCPSGMEPSPPCHTGKIIDADELQQCKLCKHGFFKKGRNRDACSPCSSFHCLPNHEILKNCTIFHPAFCSHRCKDGYFKNKREECIPCCGCNWASEDVAQETCKIGKECEMIHEKCKQSSLHSTKVKGIEKSSATTPARQHPVASITKHSATILIPKFSSTKPSPNEKRPRTAQPPSRVPSLSLGTIKTDVKTTSPTSSTSKQTITEKIKRVLHVTTPNTDKARKVLHVTTPTTGKTKRTISPVVASGETKNCTNAGISIEAIVGLVLFIVLLLLGLLYFLVRKYPVRQLEFCTNPCEAWYRRCDRVEEYRMQTKKNCVPGCEACTEVTLDSCHAYLDTLVNDHLRGEDCQRVLAQFDIALLPAEKERITGSSLVDKLKTMKPYLTLQQFLVVLRKLGFESLIKNIHKFLHEENSDPDS